MEVMEVVEIREPRRSRDRAGMRCVEGTWRMASGKEGVFQVSWSHTFTRVSVPVGYRCHREIMTQILSKHMDTLNEWAGRFEC